MHVPKCSHQNKHKPLQEPSQMTNAHPFPTGFAHIVQAQHVHLIDSLELESGAEVHQCSVAYKTWGSLNEDASNCLVLCHALSGSADASDWWGELLGEALPFDPTKFFIFCGNVLGSPYGSSSPCTQDPATKLPYGPSFPQTTIRDDVQAHKQVLDALGVKRVAFAVGGSMGGMLALEWAMIFPSFIDNLVLVATCAYHSAWCIGWGEMQRQAIFADPNYNNGWYTADNQPIAGLAAARMAAMMTYRTGASFEARFGRKLMGDSTRRDIDASNSNVHVVNHNEGLLYGSSLQPSTQNLALNGASKNKMYPVFSSQSYLRYQGDKFVQRFDANCYISITRKLDTHDVSRSRPFASPAEALASLQHKTLVVGISSDTLFTAADQRYIGSHMPNARTVILESDEGHDGFLLELERMRELLTEFMDECLPALGIGRYADGSQWSKDRAVADCQRVSVFGEDFTES